ncbi:hypothetical protein GE061_008186 [Apolygus lucorum]|uniref:Uncharacterized protein n=1 Tax=Apolygus lucorum TaxID=248454 RepID=A0A8S9WQN5_APOLU|nr:hypothetical protein GE061_008186 [Apolygus lucorum]
MLSRAYTIRGEGRRALTYEEEDASAAPDYDESELDPEDLTNAPKRPKKDGKRLRNMLIKIAEQLLLAMVLHFKEELETWKINPTELREIPTVIKFSLITHPRCLQTWFARLVHHFAKDVAKLPGTASGIPAVETDISRSWMLSRAYTIRGEGRRALTYEEEDASAAPDYDESELDPEDLTNAPKRPKKDGKRLRNMLIKIAEQLLLAMVLHFKEELETWKINPTELREIPTVIKFSLITHPRCLQTWFARLVHHFAKDVAKLPGTASGLRNFARADGKRRFVFHDTPQSKDAVWGILQKLKDESIVIVSLPRRYAEIISDEKLKSYETGV